MMLSASVLELARINGIPVDDETMTSRVAFGSEAAA